MQYPKGKEISFSYGKIRLIKDDKIVHSASTNKGSSGSPIIRKCLKNYYIIGLHYGGKKNGKNIYLYNFGTLFNYILYDINKNEINCIYDNTNNKNNEIQLLHDYSITGLKDKESEKLYLEVKNINKKLFEESVELYINGNKTKFDYKYKFNENKEIKVKFLFKKNLTNMSYMFKSCFSLKYIDLSKVNTNFVTNMSYMFFNCSSLKSIDLSNFNTKNGTKIKRLFDGCSSLINIKY